MAGSRKFYTAVLFDLLYDRGPGESSIQLGIKSLCLGLLLSEWPTLGHVMGET